MTRTPRQSAIPTSMSNQTPASSSTPHMIKQRMSEKISLGSSSILTEPFEGLADPSSTRADFKNVHDDSESSERNKLCPQARLRLHLDDLQHPGSLKFTKLVPLSDVLQKAVLHVQSQLFRRSNVGGALSGQTLARNVQRPPQRPIKPIYEPQEVRSVTLIVRPMDGVAYTTGTNLDEAHKEIHLNLNYVKDVAERSTDDDFVHEMYGVITHEMVHVFQHNAHGSCPGGLVEGIADYVRMKAGLGAKHWKSFPANEDTRGKKFDEGYQKTAWFLCWVEEEFGSGCIQYLNHLMQKHGWGDGKVWKDAVGESVDHCWKAYVKAWDSMNKKHDKEGTEEVMVVKEFIA